MNKNINKRLIETVSVLLLLGLLSFGLARNFRLNDWGVSQSTVRENETYSYTQAQGNTLTYTAGKTMFGLEATVGYVFTMNDELAAGTYIFKDRASANGYLEDYETAKEILISLYGQPKQEELIWQDDSKQVDEADYGKAIKKGELQLETRWENQDEVIVLRLYAEKKNIMNRVDYLSKTYYPKYQADIEEYGEEALKNQTFDSAHH